MNYGEGGLEVGKDHWEPEQEGPELTAPTRPQRPKTQSESQLPDWLPARFLEGKDPEKDGGK